MSKRTQPYDDNLGPKPMRRKVVGEDDQTSTIIHKQEVEIVVEAAQSSPTPRRNDADEESDLKEFEEIPPEDITVAIFCALAYESVAVKYSFDEEFECHPKIIGPRKYVYSFGRIGDHKVIIARPHQMGTVKAAQCASTVSQQFPNIRFALMVGIGAGIPSLSKCDIRLGDIAVSIPRDNHPGVVEYDFGKYELDGTFVLKGSLDKPPSILISADGSLEEDEMMSRSSLRRILRDITKHREYVRPDIGDVLFDRMFHHVNKGNDCSGCEASKEVKIIPRVERNKNPRQPVVHRGLILSGGGVVKNPEDRDRLRRAHDDAICFEMEAAGILDEIPCLVVRGICDYADTHKQDGWHYYAAAVAAAYGKAVLLKVHRQDVEQTRGMKEIMEKLKQKINQISNDVNDLKQEANSAKEAREKKEVLQWLTPIDYSRWQTDYIGRRQKGTGQWLLASKEYQTWLKTRGQTLFCPGIPGAGKTIITSIVVQHLQISQENSSIAYLYCNVGRQHEQTLENLLKSILKQLVQTQPSLPKSVKDLYERHKENKSQPEPKEISEILQALIFLDSRSFIIIDALDECQNRDGCRDNLLSQIFALQIKTKLNLFATSRHQEVETQFSGCISLEICAVEDDIKSYLNEQISQWEKSHCDIFDDDLRDRIETEITREAEGMFLLAYLNMNAIQSQQTKRDVKNALKKLAKGEKELDKAYQQTIERIQSQEEGSKKLANRTLAWIVHAKRPLSTIELLHALAVWPHDIKLDKDGLPSIESLLSVCSGLIRLDEKSQIFDLVHKTTRDYLESTKATRFPNAERDIAITCVTYLSFDTFKSGFCKTDKDLERRLLFNPLYGYAASNWGYHASKALNLCQEVLDFLEYQVKVKASIQALMAHKLFSGHFNYSQNFPKQMTGLNLAAYFGIYEVVNTLIGHGQSPDSKDGDGCTPLHYVAMSGHEAVVKLLLEKGAKSESKDEDGETPLSVAAERGHEAIVELLLEKSPELESKGRYGWTPLSMAARNGHEAVVKLLLEKGAKLESENNYDQTPLSIAAECGHEAVVKLLLEKGAKSESKGCRWSDATFIGCRAWARDSSKAATGEGR